MGISRSRVLALAGVVYTLLAGYVFYLQYKTLGSLQVQRFEQNLERENSLIYFVDRLHEIRGDIDCREKVSFLANVPNLWGDFFVDGLSNYTLSPCYIDHFLEQPLSVPPADHTYVVIHRSHAAYPAFADESARVGRPEELEGFNTKRRTEHYVLLERESRPE